LTRHRPGDHSCLSQVPFYSQRGGLVTRFRARHFSAKKAFAPGYKCSRDPRFCSARFCLY
jgi:hypothetical protein